MKIEIEQAEIDRAKIQVFGKASPNWTEDPIHNLMFLKIQEQYTNDMLHVRGHVFLNDVLDGLGFRKSGVGAVIGWKKSETVRQIEFNSTLNKDGSIRLDFNVDGVIADKI